MKAGAQAFSLVEVLVAAAIGAIIFTSLYAGISNSFSLLNTARANLRATQIMVSRMEGLRLCAWGNGTNLDQLFNPATVPTQFTDYFYPQGINGDTNNLGATYVGAIAWSTNFALNPPSSYSNRMCRVTVTVTWTNGLGRWARTQSRSMSTYVAQYGEQNYIWGDN